MTPHDNGHRRFEVKNSQEVGNQTKALLRRAIELGRRDEFLNAAKRLLEKLQQHADTFGEPLYTLSTLGLQMRVGLIGPLSVRYALNLAAHKLFVAAIQSSIPLD